MVSKKEKEKNRQNHINCRETIPFVLHTRKQINIRSKRFVSEAAARDRICFTSPGCGRRVVELSACGIFFKKLTTSGFSSLSSIPVFPCSCINACCFLTTTSGKS